MIAILEGYLRVEEGGHESDMFYLYVDKTMKDFLRARNMVEELAFLNGSKVRITIEEGKVVIEKVDD